MAFQKGQNKGKKYEELYGIERAKEIRKKISIGNKGKIMPREVVERLSRARIGKPSPLKGIPKPEIRGKNHPNYGGKNHTLEWRRKVSEAHKKRWDRIGRPGRIRPLSQLKDLEQKLWREQIFKRDNWTCWICEIKGGSLHAHHLFSYAKFPELRFKINNGLTLCMFCHQTYTEWGGFRK